MFRCRTQNTEKYFQDLTTRIMIKHINGKGKAFPVQALRVPGGSDSQVL